MLRWVYLNLAMMFQQNLKPMVSLYDFCLQFEGNYITKQTLQPLQKEDLRMNQLMLISEEIKPVALAVFELCLYEDISK